MTKPGVSQCFLCTQLHHFSESQCTRFSPNISSEVLMSGIGCIGRGLIFCMGLDCWISIKILHLQFLQVQTHFKNSVSDLPSNLWTLLCVIFESGLRFVPQVSEWMNEKLPGSAFEAHMHTPSVVPRSSSAAAPCSAFSGWLLLLLAPMQNNQTA